MRLARLCVLLVAAVAVMGAVRAQDKFLWTVSNESACSKPCGGGTRTQEVSCTDSQSNTVDDINCSGKKPPSVAICNEQPCSSFMWQAGKFGPCSKSCQGGFQTRPVTCFDSTTKSMTASKNCDQKFKPLDTQPCNSNIQCIATNKTNSTNTSSHGNTTAPSGGAGTNGTEKIPGSWFTGPWQNCSHPCGGGNQSRVVFCQGLKALEQVESAVCAGMPKPASSRACHTQPCAAYSWFTGPFGTCSKSCGGGTYSRMVLCKNNQTAEAVSTDKCSGAPPPALLSCNIQACPANYTWFTGVYGQCSQSCGGGESRRPVLCRTDNLTVVPDAHCNSTEKPAVVHVCNMQPCPVISWFTAPWGTCTKSCGGGVQTRYVSCASSNGMDTPQDACAALPKPATTQACHTEACPTYVYEGGAWSNCTKPCGGGERHRELVCRMQGVPQDVNMSHCHNATLLPKKEACNVHACPRDCVEGAWTDTGVCSKSCGGGVKQQTRELEQPVGSGRQCGPRFREVGCNLQGCPVDCQISDWVNGSCSEACGGGVLERTRTVTRWPSDGGKACPLTSEVAPCNTQACPPPAPKDCKMSDWVATSSCSATCGAGVHTQTRHMIAPPSVGGKPCGATQRTAPCVGAPCPSNCVLSEWDTDAPCSVTCGDGQSVQTRTVLVEAAHGGTCPNNTLKRHIPCSRPACPKPVNCVLSPWVNDGNCTGSCGYGLQKQVRHVVTAAHSGGGCSYPLARSVPCKHTQSCDTKPTECNLSPWRSVQPCSCTLRQVKQTRVVIGSHSHAHPSCGQPLVRHYTCPTHTCSSDQSTVVSVPAVHALPANTYRAKSDEYMSPESFLYAVDCHMSEWREVSPCSAQCGGGFRRQTRTVIRPADGGGKCYATERVTPCNAHKCTTPSSAPPAATESASPCQPLSILRGPSSRSFKALHEHKHRVEAAMNQLRSVCVGKRASCAKTHSTCRESCTSEAQSCVAACQAQHDRCHASTRCRCEQLVQAQQSFLEVTDTIARKVVSV